MDEQEIREFAVRLRHRAMSILPVDDRYELAQDRLLAAAYHCERAANALETAER